jgi:hypothetical protein
MRAGDRLHDCKPEADAAATRARDIRPAEALERVRKELGWEPFTLVADGEHEPAVLGACLEPYRAFAVPKGVVDEVSERLLEALAISSNDLILRRRHLECAAGSPRTRVAPACNRSEQPADVVPFDAEEEPSIVGAGEHQEVLREPDETLYLLSC